MQAVANIVGNSTDDGVKLGWFREGISFTDEHHLNSTRATLAAQRTGRVAGNHFHTVLFSRDQLLDVSQIDCQRCFFCLWVESCRASVGEDLGAVHENLRWTNATA